MRAVLLSIVMCTLFAGCAANCPVPKIVDTGCDWTPSLSASTDDTPATKREIIAYETARQQNCRQHRKARTSPTGG